MECKKCGQEVVARHPNQRYCSVKCRNSYWGQRGYLRNRDQILVKRRTPEARSKENAYKKTPAQRRYHREYVSHRRRTDPVFRLKMSINDRLRKLALHGYRIGRIEEGLGYSIESLYRELASAPGYSETDYLAGLLELDHIVPLHWFIVIEFGDEEFRKCWNVRNLRFVPSTHNVARRRKSFDWTEVSSLGIQDLLPKGADVIWQSVRIKHEDSIRIREQ